MNTAFLYVTAKDEDEARGIGRALLEARIAACINILPVMHSMYWWEGVIQEEREVVLVAKTTGALVGKATERIKELHSYDCPCVVAIPIEDGNQDFIRWIEQETQSPEDG